MPTDSNPIANLITNANKKLTYYTSTNTSMHNTIVMNTNTHHQTLGDTNAAIILAISMNVTTI